jgi:hypothetical protein
VSEITSGWSVVNGPKWPDLGPASLQFWGQDGWYYPCIKTINMIREEILWETYLYSGRPASICIQSKAKSIWRTNGDIRLTIVWDVFRTTLGWTRIILETEILYVTYFQKSQRNRGWSQFLDNTILFWLNLFTTGALVRLVQHTFPVDRFEKLLTIVRIPTAPRWAEVPKIGHCAPRALPANNQPAFTIIWLD